MLTYLGLAERRAGRESRENMRRAAVRRLSICPNVKRGVHTEEQFSMTLEKDNRGLSMCQ